MLRTTLGVRELVFLVQGTAAPPPNVSLAILKFVDAMPKMMKAMPDAEFA